LKRLWAGNRFLFGELSFVITFLLPSNFEPVKLGRSCCSLLMIEDMTSIKCGTTVYTFCKLSRRLFYFLVFSLSFFYFKLNWFLWDEVFASQLYWDTLYESRLSFVCIAKYFLSFFTTFCYIYLPWVFYTKFFFFIFS
jgi:hypothetical protein